MTQQPNNWHSLSGDEVLKNLETQATGLTNEEVTRRRQEYGSNTLSRARGDSPWLMFWRQINNPIGWLLVAAGVIAVLLKKYTDATVVFGAVVVNAIIGFVQEYRAGQAIAALSAMVPETATTLRDGRPVSLPSAELVPGDIVTLQSGDKIPADLRLIQVKNLLVEEAALTGESLPTGKRTDAADAAAPLGDRLGMAYSGTMVIQGTATGVVVTTGDHTELGRINELLNQTNQLETPLTHQLAKVSIWITAAVVAISIILFLFGILIKHAPMGEALMVAITLAVAAIPEGLPSVITIALAVGVRRMATRHAVVRHLPSVETLGSTSVICSDKTGTLTRNEMTVQIAWADQQEYRFAGVGYAPEGEVEHNGQRITDLPAALRELLLTAVLCSDAEVRPEDGAWAITGDPTEAAMVVAGEKAGLKAPELRQKYLRKDVIPFESENQFMATLNEVDGATRLFLKGAPEVVMKRCKLSETERRNILAVMETYARQGLRVIAFAHKEQNAPLNPESLPQDMAFCGLMGMMDPPRTEAMDAIRVCHSAGITVKMITGDHPTTAEAIGRQLGLLTPAQTAMQGRELDGLTDEQLQAAANRTNVFARVAPEHKIKLVEALQAQRQIVAMTGDGVNDAPALKRADIGIAMGITGTAVSKEAAKVILADDNFASIAAAVEEGRRVYDNLIKSLAFVLPTNLGLAATLSFAMFFFPTVTVNGVTELLLAMSPTQTLWINLVASVALSIPLAFEVIEPQAMRRKPRPPDEAVFSAFIVFRLIMVAAIMAVAACGVFMWEYNHFASQGHAFALAQAQTVCVTTITFTQIFYLFNCRSLRDSFFSLGVFSNPSVFIGIGVLLLLQACFIYLPPLQALFGSASMTGETWLHAMLAGALVLPVISIEKWLCKRWGRTPTATAKPVAV